MYFWMCENGRCGNFMFVPIGAARYKMICTDCMHMDVYDVHPDGTIEKNMNIL